MILLISGCVLLSLLLFPQPCANSVRTALRIWSIDVVPSLFPYMVFCRLLSERLRKKQFPAYITVPCLGLLGGSPSGASILCVSCSSLSRKIQIILCALTGTLSPMFFIGTVNSWIHDNHMSILLLLAHLFGACFASILVFLFFDDRFFFVSDTLPSSPFQETDPIQGSLQSILIVGGCIVIFSVLAELIRLFPFISIRAAAMAHAFLEAAGGMHELTQQSLDRETLAILLAAFSGFSGLSILYQNALFVRPLGIRMQTLIVLAFFRALGSAVCMKGMLYFNIH